MTAPIPTTTDALFQIIDILWSELPAEQIASIEAHSPEVIEACKHIHEIMYHGNEKSGAPEGAPPESS